MAHKIHVLLVEHDSKDHDKTMTMLRYFSYEVTVVKLASKALSILQKEKVKFDLLMVNMNSPDSCAFQLLQDAIHRDMLVILMMSNDEDSATITRAIEQGAFLCIKKPITLQITGYLWQHVVREKVRKLKDSTCSTDDNNNLHQQFQDQRGDHNNNNNAQEKYKSNKIVSSENTSQNDNVNFKKKVWTEWSEELHQKFMAAVIQLGEGRCYPRDILELMNEPGLTRMQVASHLQKCRNAGRLPSKEKNSKKANTETTTPTKKVRGSKSKRFGLMPHVDNSMFNSGSQKYHQEITVNPPTETNVHESSGEGYHPQLVFGHDDSYPFAQDNETFNMGQLEQTFGMDESLISDDTFEGPNMDPMTQIFSALQQEIGMNYNGTLQSFVLDEDVNLNQMSNVANGISEHNREEPNPVDAEEYFEG